MRPSSLALLVVAALAGCAAERPSGYHSAYLVEGSTTQLDAISAEKAHAKQVNSGAFAEAGKRFDRPLELLNAPQPVMSREDTDARVVGHVGVKIYFGEDGTTERAEIVSSTKESLSAAVMASVIHWKIAPAYRSGVPSKVVVYQPFNFQTQR